MTNVVALVLAGGNGSRLQPLTAEHSKPALELAHGYRIIDYVLANLINSGIASIHVLVQYKPRSLLEHIDTAWAPWSRGRDRVIRVTCPRSEGDEAAFTGTANAVYQSLHLVAYYEPDVVAVFAADHVYRMDVRQMVDFHRRQRAEVTVAAIPVPLAQAPLFGIMEVGADGRVREFREKPVQPTPMPGKPGHAYASMGNYLFDRRVLVALLDDAHRRGGTDFGRHVLPHAACGHRMLAYDFTSNRVPGIKPYEEHAYWRDIGTLDGYHAAQRDVLGPLPRFRLQSPEWPIRGERLRARETVPAILDAVSRPSIGYGARRPSVRSHRVDRRT